MRVLAGLTAALVAAAIVFALEFVVEGVAAGEQTLPGIILTGIVLNMIIGFPSVLVGGLPIWFLFRSRQVRSPWAFTGAGATLALVTYLLLVLLGMGQPSDHPMTFLENIERPFHLPRIIAAMVAGVAGAAVFWFIMARRFPRSHHPQPKGCSTYR